MRAFRTRCARVLALAALAAVLVSVPQPAAGTPPQFEQGGSPWQAGPMTAALGDVAEVDVPDDYMFADAATTQAMLEMSQNLVSGYELGTVTPVAEEEDWFIFFEFDEVGYVKDDDRDELDADALLKSIRASSKAGNAERRKRGFPTMEVEGWEVPPRYNPETNNLEWAVRFSSEGNPVVNHNTRLLGRKGVMEVSLVADPEDLQRVLPHLAMVLEGYRFQSGQRYAEYRSGDKIAEYGLAGLVLGGAAAAAFKTGLFSKLWKFLVAGAVAVAVFAKKIFGGGRQENRYARRASERDEELEG